MVEVSVVVVERAEVRLMPGGGEVVVLAFRKANGLVLTPAGGGCDGVLDDNIVVSLKS